MRHFSGEFKGIRPLLLEELAKIAGGDGEDTDDVTTLNHVVSKPDAINGHTAYFVPLVWSFGSMNPGTTYDNPEPSDTSAMHLEINLTGITPQQQQAIDHLTAAITAATTAIDGIPNSQIITLSDGSTVSGQELKTIWAATDFVINPKDTHYDNTVNTGQANYNNGNPVVSYNIDTLTGYDILSGGMNYLALHELGHMTAAGRAFTSAHPSSGGEINPANEQFANDIARAIANHGGIQVLNPLTAAPIGGYSTETPIIFQTPSTGGGGGSGGGGGGACVSVDSLLPGNLRAGDVKVGDTLELMDPVTMQHGSGVVTYSKAEEVQMVKVITKGGIELSCSTTAPIPILGGELILAPNLTGQKILTRTGNGYSDDVVEEVAELGMGFVQHITVGDRCFWAGTDGSSFILHHNIKKGPDPGDP